MRRIFSLDHKTIGLQYGVTSAGFLLIGFTLMMLMRWQLAYPMQPIPLIGGLLGSHNVANGIMLPEFSNQLGAMHGTIFLIASSLLGSSRCSRACITGSRKSRDAFSTTDWDA